MSHSRSNPSPRYRQLVELYVRMHADGVPNLGLPADKTFSGFSLFPLLEPIKRLIDATRAKTILDYGAGKGRQYRPQRIAVGGLVAECVAEYWDVDDVRCYDPGYPPHSALPQGRFDGVICTDVLEHCPEEDLEWIVRELFAYARSFVFANVACYPALKRLPNGENAHVTVRAAQWWRELCARAAAEHPGVIWELHADELAGDRKLSRVFRGSSQAAS